MPDMLLGIQLQTQDLRQDVQEVRIVGILFLLETSCLFDRISLSFSHVGDLCC